MRYARWEVRAFKNMSFRGDDISIMMRMRSSLDPNDPDLIMTFVPYELKDEDMGKKLDDSYSLNLPTEIAQNLMDELWSCGLRPTEGSGSVGSLKATQDHLNDVQVLNERLLTMVEKRWDK